MNIKNLFLFACLLSASLLGANNPPSSVASPAPASLDGGICNLPAPFFFHIEEVGTTWAKYVWGGSVTTEYRLRTYRDSDDSLLNTTIIPPGGNLATVIDSLPPGTGIYGIINAVCSDGSNSPNEAQSSPGSTLILELLVNGYYPPGRGDVTCTIQGTWYCEFSSNPTVTTAFRISRTTSPYSSRIFGMKLESATPQKHKACFYESNGSDASLFDFKCSSSTEPNCQVNIGQIWYTGESPAVQIGTFYTSLEDQTTSKLHATLAANYKIDMYSDSEFRPTDPSKGQTFTFSPTSGIATASPNPFSEALEVFPANSTAEQITLQLFNLSGQKVLDQQFTGGQEQYSLPTAGLSPGFYMLRIEADGEVQTLKVIKSE